MNWNPLVAKHSWETVLVQIVEGLEDGSVVLPADAPSPSGPVVHVGTEEIVRWKEREPFVPFRLITTDNIVYEVERPDLLMVGLTSVVIGRPAPGDPSRYSQYQVVGLDRVARLERGGETFGVR